MTRLVKRASGPYAFGLGFTFTQDKAMPLYYAPYLRHGFPGDRPLMKYQKIVVPSQGQKITVNSDNTLNVPDQPIIPFVEGDGIGIDITPAMRNVVDTAIRKAYGDKRAIVWMEVYAGEKAVKTYGGDAWLPGETLQALEEYVVSIKG